MVRLSQHIQSTNCNTQYKSYRIQLMGFTWISTTKTEVMVFQGKHTITSKSVFEITLLYKQTVWNISVSKSYTNVKEKFTKNFNYYSAIGVLT